MTELLEVSTVEAEQPCEQSAHWTAGFLCFLWCVRTSSKLLIIIALISQAVPYFNPATLETGNFHPPGLWLPLSHCLCAKPHRRKQELHLQMWSLWEIIRVSVSSVWKNLCIFKSAPKSSKMLGSFCPKISTPLSNPQHAGEVEEPHLGPLVDSALERHKISKSQASAIHPFPSMCQTRGTCLSLVQIRENGGIWQSLLPLCEQK